MKTAFKILVLYCLTVAILLSLISCDWDGIGDEESLQEDGTTDEPLFLTTPQVTTHQETTPELNDFGTTTPNESAPNESIPNESIPIESTPEETTPMVTTPDLETSTVEILQNTTPAESTTSKAPAISAETTVPKETTGPEETTTVEEITTFEEITTPEETTTPEPPHEHMVINGQCACGFVPIIVNSSKYDNDKDGEKDVFYFSPLLPEKFENGNVIHLSAGEFVPGLSALVGMTYEGNYYYCRESDRSCIVYEIEVDEAGVYEVAVHQKMSDCEERGAKYTVNEGSGEKYSFQTSYEFTTEQALMAVCKNETTMSSYMFGIELELVAGVNYIKIEAASGIENNQYFRDFYLVKMED